MELPKPRPINWDTITTGGRASKGGAEAYARELEAMVAQLTKERDALHHRLEWAKLSLRAAQTQPTSSGNSVDPSIGFVDGIRLALERERSARRDLEQANGELGGRLAEAEHRLAEALAASADLATLRADFAQVQKERGAAAETISLLEGELIEVRHECLAARLKVADLESSAIPIPVPPEEPKSVPTPPAEERVVKPASEVVVAEPLGNTLGERLAVLQEGSPEDRAFADQCERESRKIAAARQAVDELTGLATDDFCGQWLTPVVNPVRRIQPIFHVDRSEIWNPVCSLLDGLRLEVLQAAQRRGIEVIAPVPGVAPFDPVLHEESPSHRLPAPIDRPHLAGMIYETISPGFRIEGRTLTKAYVKVYTRG